MKIYITGLPSGYEVEHLVRLFYPMAPLTLTPPEEGEDCVWAEKKEDSLYAMVREQGQSRDAAAPLPRPVEAGGSTKLVADGGRRMQRIFNFKYPTEYIQRFAEVLERKKGVADFYDHDLGPETSG